MHERQLHRVLAKHSELIEPGLTYLDSEVAIGKGLRCDLLFRDASGKRVYVEVKWIASRRACVQVEQYELLALENKQQSRFILVSVAAKQGIPELVGRRGFEYIQLDKNALQKLEPDWQLPSSSIGTGLAPKTLKSWSSWDHESLLLGSILDSLQDELPSLRFVKHKEGPRLVLNWSGPDSFIIDFSSRVSDGIRCGFVVDLDVPDSERRSQFQAHLLKRQNEVEDTLGAVVVNGVGEQRLIESGYTRWVKVTNHRRMGVCGIYRAPGLDMSNPSLVVEAYSPLVCQFIDKMDSLLESN